MQISLRNTKVENIDFKRIEGSLEEDAVELTYSDGYSEEHKASFIVRFNLALKSKESFALSMVYVAYFDADDELDDKFKNSHFPKVNAPAIAYPFLRSFISTLTVNAGYGAVLLPTINFQALATQKNE